MSAADDLALARACLAGDPVALATLERDHLAATSEVLARSGVARDLAQDVMSILRERLLLGRAEAAPLLASYDGRGALSGWLRVCALRELAVQRRKALRDGSVAGAFERERTVMSLDPELAYVKALYHHEFDAAFAAGLAALTPRQRNLLRHQTVHGLGVEQIGGLYRVHHATVARWIEAARGELAERTREALGAKLQIAEADLQSVLRLIRSRIDVGLKEPLGPHEE